MSTPARIGMVIVVGIAIIVVASMRPGPSPESTPMPVASHASRGSDGAARGASNLPRLVDVGAEQCIPCKAMIPVLESLRREYQGRLEVVFVDVWKNPSAGDPYHVYLIPTQIFFDPTGRELFRHQGFFSKDDILTTWRRLGFPLAGP